jgi:hypothetical protein
LELEAVEGGGNIVIYNYTGGLEKEATNQASVTQ